MARIVTPVFIPGLICTGDLFAEQHEALAIRATTDAHLAAPLLADTTSHDSITGMATAALALASGPVLPIGLSMGGYVALEMARLAPERLAGMALLSTGYKQDSPERREQRLATITMARSNKFQGVTKRLLGSFLSPTALQDEMLVARVIQMARDVGRDVFVTQQTAILGRQDQSRTLTDFTGPVAILCGLLDTLTPPDLSREMAALAPAAKLDLLADVGHLSSLEAPDAVTKSLMDLVDRAVAV